MDLFAKCAAYTTARVCREKGIYPYFHALESRQDTEVIMEGKRRIMLGSNNYLGLTAAPGECLLRMSCMATHTEALLDEAMDIIAEVLGKDENA